MLSGIVAGKWQPDNWKQTSRAVGFYDVKGDLEALFAAANGAAFSFVKAEHPALHPGRTARIHADDKPVGWIGDLHPKLQKSLNMSQLPVLFEFDREVLDQSRVPAWQALSKFPAVRRDLAISVADDVSWAMISSCVYKHAPDLLTDVRVFDVYTGQGVEDGRKSVALGLILQDFSSTLDDSEIDAATSRILNGLSEDLQATLRT